MINLMIELRRCLFFISCIALSILAGCDSDDPEPEEVPETITRAVLNFTPAGGGNALVFEASDPDGSGPQNIELDEIVLNANTTYTLTIEFYNEQVDEGDEGYNLTEEIKEEGDEHQLFFEWNPAALLDGNVLYNDEDENDLPIGLSATLTTGQGGQSGAFRVVLKHQPDIKSTTSGINDGESDFDASFDISIQ